MQFESRIMFVILYPLFCLPILIVSEKPEITFFSKGTQIDLVNKDDITFFNLNARNSFSLTARCSAKYPVQWEIVNSPFATRFVDNRRDFKIWIDPKTYIFTSTIEFLVEKHLFTGRIEEFVYSCSSTSSNCVKDELYIHSPHTNHKDIVRVNTNDNSKNEKCNWTNNYNGTINLVKYPLVSQIDITDTSIYYSTDDEDVMTLRSGHPVTTILQPQRTKSISCSTHKNIFSKGSVMAYKTTGDPAIYFLNEVVEKTSENYYELTKALPEILKASIEVVYCFAPLWNTYGWKMLSLTNIENISRISENLLNIPEIVSTAPPTGEGSIPSVIVLGSAMGGNNVTVYYFYTLIIAMALVLLLCVALTCVLRSIRLRKRETQMNKRLLPEWDTLMSPTSSSATITESCNWHQILLSDLTIDETTKLGHGNFGLVLKGALRTNSGDIDVAVKRPLSKEAPCMNLFKKELEITSKIRRHKNIVKAFGAVMEDYQTVSCVVMEYCSRGNLRKYLLENRSNFENANRHHYSEITERSTISLNTLLSWAADIARGMEFLSCAKIVHGDLAARNILLSADNTAKLSDFGLSKELEQYYYYFSNRKQAPMPWKWMSYESLKQQKLSIKSDIWAYGITLWEIFTLGDIPWVGLKYTSEFIENLEAGVRPSKPQNANEEIYGIMQQCWALETRNRPQFAEILHKLQSINAGLPFGVHFENSYVLNISNVHRWPNSLHDS